MPKITGDRAHSGRSGSPYDDLVTDALRAPITGWDFSWLIGRADCEDLPWDYMARARRAVSHATCLLDIDTGGGEVLASLAPLPAAIATEPYPPNVPIATARLGPLGVNVRAGTAAALPVGAGEVDLVLNRHGALDPSEIARVLAPQGVFLTNRSAAATTLRSTMHSARLRHPTRTCTRSP
ncbi:MAG: methyltransferase domain-containing protein [Cellulomonas sp.]